MQYKDLNHALKKFRGQVIESIPYAIENFPTFTSPERAFNYLKLRTTYKKDPKGVELFQTLPTLIDNNEHGITGAGDCDCFTIAALATLIASGFTDCGIVLVGRNPLCAVHIYAYVNVNGEREYFDLTNRRYNYERHYPFKQHIPFKLNQTEKNMMLQLADGPSRTAVHPYIHFPNKRIQVREDYFDNMSAGEFQNMCLEEGVPLSEIEELSGRRAERKAEKRQFKTAKRQGKIAKRTARTDNKKARAQKNRDKGEARKMKAQARIDKANRPAPQRSNPFAPAANPYAAPDMYNDPQEGQEVEVYEEEVDQEQSPEEVYETEMEEMFMGEANVLGMNVSKGLLWGLGLTIAGVAVGRAVKHRNKGRRAA